MTDQKQLRLEVVWTDEQLIELLASASNGRFCGTTKVYTTGEHLLEIAESLKGFPRKVTDVLTFAFGESGSYSFLSLRFYCVNGVGHTAVQITMEENITHGSSVIEEEHKASFELRYDAGLINQFQQALRRMAQVRDGYVSLF
jgi:hypothetical protein